MSCPFGHLQYPVRWYVAIKILKTFLEVVKNESSEIYDIPSVTFEDKKIEGPREAFTAKTMEEIAQKIDAMENPRQYVFHIIERTVNCKECFNEGNTTSPCPHPTRPVNNKRVGKMIVWD
jgi:hypothetical protein